jgi:hypothetical protein
MVLNVIFFFFPKNTYQVEPLTFTSLDHWDYSIVPDMVILTLVAKRVIVF